MYRVSQHVGSNLPLTSKQKFSFGLPCPDLARPKQNLCFDVNGRFEPTCCVTLYYFTVQISSTLALRRISPLFQLKIQDNDKIMNNGNVRGVVPYSNM